MFDGSSDLGPGAIIRINHLITGHQMSPRLSVISFSRTPDTPGLYTSFTALKAPVYGVSMMAVCRPILVTMSRPATILRGMG